MFTATLDTNVSAWGKRLDHMEFLVFQFARRLGLAESGLADADVLTQRMEARLAINGWPEWRHNHFNRFCAAVYRTLQAMRPFFSMTGLHRAYTILHSRMLALLQKIREIQEKVEELFDESGPPEANPSPSSPNPGPLRGNVYH